MSDYCTVPMPLAGHPGDLDPRRAGAARRRRARAARRLPDRGPGVQRDGPARRRLRAGAGDRRSTAAAVAERGRRMTYASGNPQLTDEEMPRGRAEALDALPAEIASSSPNVAVLVEDRHPDEEPDRHLRPDRGPAADRDLPRDQSRAATRSRRPSSTRSGTTSAPTSRPSRGGGSDGRGDDRVRGRDRAGDPRPALDEDEDVLRLRALASATSPNVHTCPVCLGHPGTLPTANEQAIRYGLMIAARARVRGRAALDLRPQELLLSRPAEGLPDQPVRPAACGQRASSATSASTAPTWRRTPPS